MNPPIVSAVAKLAHCDWKWRHPMRLEQFLQPHNAIVILIDYGESLPAPVAHNIHISLSTNTNISS